MKDNVRYRKFSDEYMDGMTASRWVAWAKTLTWLYTEESESSERS